MNVWPPASRAACATTSASAGRPDRHQHDCLARPGAAARVHDAQPGLQIIHALLGGQHAQKPDQAVDGREPGDELPA